MFVIKVAFILLFASSLATQASTTTYSVKDNVIIEKILQSYDGNMRPSGENGSSPTVVSVNFYIRSIPELDDVKMVYKTQLTFRMQWLDERLKFESTDAHRYITLPATTLGKTLWKPDLFFSNELEYSKHAGITPNEYYRVFPNGEVLHNSRITVKWSCPMIFVLYPFDKQTCCMRMASYGFTTDDIIFKWKAVDPVQLTSDLHLPSFALQQFKTDYCDSRTNTGTYSCLRVDLLFARELNRYLSKLFIPMITSILLIWVSTWITPSNSGLIMARALLLCGASFYCKWSILTGPARPSAIISYTTALDMWDTFCTGFILLGIQEFVVVLISRDCGKGCDDLNGSQDKHVCSRRIDFVTRIIYPIGFLACVCIYFGAYLAKAKEQDRDETE